MISKILNGILSINEGYFNTKLDLNLNEFNEVSDNYVKMFDYLKINYEKLNALLKQQIGKNIPTNINYPTYINGTILGMINESEEPEEKKEVISSKYKNRS